jgi:hypothetical protein
MRISMKQAALFATLAIGFAVPALAHEEVAGKLRIGHPWVRAAAEGAPDTYACIIEIKNEGNEPERLLGGSLEAAGKGVLYEIIEKDGHFTSRKVEEGLLIKPHGSIELTPTTYQIRFGKVTKPLVEGETATGTLIFEKMKNVTVTFMIEPDETAPKEDKGDAHSGHDHNKNM